MANMCKKLTFYWALERLSAQVGDTVAFQVLCTGKGLPTPFFWTGEAPIIIMFPGREKWNRDRKKA